MREMMVRELLVLTVAIWFFSILPCLHLRPSYRTNTPSLVEPRVRIEKWYDVAQPIRLTTNTRSELRASDHFVEDDLYGDGPRPAWVCFVLVCLVAYFVVAADGGGVSLLLLNLLPLFDTVGILVTITFVIVVTLEHWAEAKFRFSIFGLLVLTTILAGALGFIASL
jgi:hypothetical protein